MKATRAKQKKMQQTQPGSDAPTAAALARRAGSFSGNVAQVPNAGALQTSMGLPQGAAWDQAPLLVRVRSPLCPFACILLLLPACACVSQCTRTVSPISMLASTVSTFRRGPCGSFRRLDEPFCLLSVCLMTLPFGCPSRLLCSVFGLSAQHHECFVVLFEGVLTFLFINLHTLLVFLWNSM